MKCTFASRCKSEAAYTVIHKAVGARKEYECAACEKHAAMIGKESSEGALIKKPGMESEFYKIVKIG